MATDIPPVVIEITGTNRDFFAKLEETKALLAEFGKKVTDARLGLDDEQLVRKLAQAQAMLAALSKQAAALHLTADTEPFWAQVEGLRATLSADPASLTVDADVAPALLAMAKLRGEMAIAGAPSSAWSVPKTLAINEALKSYGYGGASAYPHPSFAINAALAGWAKEGGGGGGKNLLEAPFMGHWTGGYLRALGVPAGAAAILGPTMPIILSLAASTFAAVAGTAAVAGAAAPAAYAIGQGAAGVNSAVDAFQNAPLGTAAWQTAALGLGSAWTSIPGNFQGAVQAIITKFFSGTSPVTAQAGNWLANTITRLLGGKGATGTAFMPLVRAGENAIDGLLSHFTGALSSGKFAHFIRTLSGMVGPAFKNIGTIFSSVFDIIKSLLTMGVGGQGMKLLADSFKTLANVVASPVFLGVVSGFVSFDRFFLTIVDGIVKFVGMIDKLPGGEGLTKIIGGVVAFAVGFSAAVTILNRVIGIANKLPWVNIAKIGAPNAPGGGGELVAPVVLGGAEGLSLLGGAGLVGLAVVGGRLLATKTPLKYAPRGPGILGWTPSHWGKFLEPLNPWHPIFHAVFQPWSQLLHGAGLIHPAKGPVLPPVLHGAASGMNAAARAARQYAQALKGVFPPTSQLTGATKALEKASEGVGAALNSAITGFAPFTVGASQGPAALLANLSEQGKTVGSWAVDAQRLLARGLSPSLVQTLANQSPQELAVIQARGPGIIAALNAQWAKLQVLTVALAAKSGQAGVLGFTNALKKGLKSPHPGVVAAVVALMKELNLKVPPLRVPVTLVPPKGVAGPIGHVTPKLSPHSLAHGPINVTTHVNLKGVPSEYKAFASAIQKELAKRDRALVMSLRGGGTR